MKKEQGNIDPDQQNREEMRAIADDWWKYVIPPALALGLTLMILHFAPDEYKPYALGLLAVVGALETMWVLRDMGNEDKK